MTILARSTFNRLVQVETLLWNRCDAEVRRHLALPLGRLEVLRVIAATEHCRVNDVASRLLITVGAASKLVDRLGASGHCQRHPNPDDGRSSLITVTDVGRTALTQAEGILEPLLGQCFATADLHHLNVALSQLEQALSAAGELA